MDFSEVEKKLNYVFKDKELLRRALTLSSADNNFNNQSLEFLGDAVLEFIVSEHIFGLASDEGALTKKRAGLVCDNSLETVSRKLGLDGNLIKGCGDTKNKKAVPSAYEAVVAAVYLDGGMAAVKNFVNSTLDYNYKDVNYKGELQELLAKRGEEAQYLTRDIGTAKQPEFKTVLTVAGKTFEGFAKSKQQAEKHAAQSALAYLKNN
ncbi:MAG: hypothetical protein K2L42_03870 [Clostridia bacterium]|nr:hypothetical protein [Clostridia bacterium]